MNLISFIRKYSIYIIFILVTIFFLYQHYKILNWDFTTYILNAKYFFSQGNYFEWYREPITPLLLGIFSIFTWKILPYIYIFFVLLLHLYSSIKLAKRFNLDKNLYYLLSISPFLLLEGLKNGTELLTLSFAQLFLAYFNTNFAGIFLGLAFLTRYNALSLLPLIIFLKKPKRIVKFLIIFLVTISPWLVFNYIKTGNALLSIADAYALNIAFRDYIHEPFPFLLLLITLNYLIIFFIFGLIKKIKRINQEYILMLAILILTLIAFYRIPVKSYTIRYVFLAIIPLTYFSTFALEKIKKQIIFAFVIIILIISFLITYSHNVIDTDKLENYQEALPYLNKCITYSNNWIYLNYLGKNTKPDLYKELIPARLKSGDRVLMYYNNLENPYIKNETFLKNLPIITKNDKFILLGNRSKCNPDDEKLDMPYIIAARNTILEVYNYTGDISNCYIFFKRKLPFIC